MLLDRKSLLLIVLACAFFAGCAQIGSISGGNKDETAPRIIKSSVKQNDRNVKAQTFTFEFDERITLNPAKENVVLIPPDAAAKASISGKTLTITWDKPWKENTTYSLYMNGVVKDFHEGNDSLYTFVFSSGSSIDSSFLHVNVKEAFSNAPAQKIVVGLFENVQAQSPRYFARSNKSGNAEISAIKPGNYVVKAFEDANNNLTIDSLEKQGFDSTVHTVFFGSRDSTTLFVSTPRSVDKIKNKKFIPPGLFAMHAPFNQQSTIFLDGKPITEDQFYRKKDTLILAVSPMEQEQFTLVIGSDTINQVVNRTGKTMSLRLNFEESSADNPDTLVFHTNDFIRAIESTKIRVKLLPDSSLIPAQINFNKQYLNISGLSSRSGNFILECDQSAITGNSGNTNTLKLQVAFSIKSDRELGTLHLKITKEGSYIVRLLKDGKSQKQLSFKGSSITLPRLVPGKYDIQLILDANQNGEWDPIDPKKNVQPEHVLYFPEAVTIRANWDVEKKIELD